MRRLAALSLLMLHLWSLAGAGFCAAGCSSLFGNEAADCADGIVATGPLSPATSTAQLSSVTDCIVGDSCCTLVVASRVVLVPEYTTFAVASPVVWTPASPIVTERPAPPLPPPNA